MTAFYSDPETQEALLGIAASAAGSLGIASTITIPAVVLVKLILRMSDSGVEIPSEVDLTTLQEELRSLGELPG
jgi:hypothetical protein